jgi:DNA-directed RNA polymerase specialized sigma subunit
VVILATVSFYEVKKVIGEEAAKKMMDAFPSMDLHIPNRMHEFPSFEARNQYIRNLYYSAGKTIEDIAPRVGLSSDRVRKIIYQK